MSGHRLFIISENPKERMEFSQLFEGMGLRVDSAPSGDDVDIYLAEKEPDLIIADDTTPGLDALGLLAYLVENLPQTQVIFITSEPQVDHALNLMKSGALEYLVKPIGQPQLELCVKRAILSRARMKEPKDLVNEHAPKSAKAGVKIITHDPGMLNLIQLVDRVADSSASVLIQGESGTGKELFAKYIHEKSSRSAAPFIAINCAALPENLLESELFGHEKGAFTGAISRKLGKFELAHNGTLFLDEITEMQIHLQAKLLRVLQEKMVDRVGGVQPVNVDVRVIATTNRNASESVEKGEFRQDLFYRLNTIPIVIPPLRHRMNDLGELCQHFIKKYCKIDGRNVKGVTKLALERLTRHNFSGNVRELENIIHRAVLLSLSGKIEPGDLMLDTLPSGDSEGQVAMDVAPPMPSSLKEMEQQMIFKTLDQTEGNRTHAAKILGISVRTLRNKLNEYKENH